MIQRVQSIYLFLGSLALLGTVFTDVMGGSAEGPTVESVAWLPIVISALGGVIFLGAIGAIFLYQQRQNQRKVILAVQILTLIFLAVVFVGLYLEGRFVSLGGNFGLIIGIVLPMVAYLCFFLARRGVEKDIKLIASMDRLR